MALQADRIGRIHLVLLDLVMLKQTLLRKPLIPRSCVPPVLRKAARDKDQQPLLLPNLSAGRKRGHKTRLREAWTFMLSFPLAVARLMRLRRFYAINSCAS